MVDGIVAGRYRVRVVLVSADLETIRSQLRRKQPLRQALAEVTRHAAVATILRPVPGDTEVLLIRRAERPGDPWSGHMAFPGGHREPDDADLKATAMRETLEEVGLDLRAHEYLGGLDELPAVARGRFVGMVIAPHVFALRAPVELRPNDEVAAVVWGRLGPMLRGEIDAIKELRYDGELRRLPAFQVRDHLVWGMTHHMLRSLLRVLEDAA